MIQAWTPGRHTVRRGARDGDRPPRAGAVRQTLNVTTLGVTDIVRTAAEAAALERPPLIVIDALERWLDERSLGSGSIEATPLEGGHSNVSIRIQRGDLDAVVRRPPRPPLPPGAHDVIREAQLLRALERTDVPAPRIYATCESDEVLGAPFAVMEFVPGYVIGSALPPALEPALERRNAAESFIGALTAVHAVDVRASGLEWLGRPGSYLERQLRRFSGSWKINRTRQLTSMDELERRLMARVPVSSETTLVHGDARLGNAIFAPEAPAHLAALLDWEMATLGDPLADLGYLSAAWTDVGQRDVPMFHLSSATASEGFPTLTELISLYEQTTGRSAEALPWYFALACWKSAVFMEGNYRRALVGSSDDPFALGFRTGVEELAELGLSAIRGQLGTRL
jgi:aminoglycoside phosphotransferase (APT) family kinase protein